MPLVIPIFIPHEGCPHCCVFCNQKTISGQSGNALVSGSDVGRIIEKWLSYRNCSRTGGDDNVQVAFYGGSFTGLPLSRQQELLSAVQPYLQNNLVDTIRLSTRPDYISSEIISFLLDHHVSIVELGVQTLDNKALVAVHRGHDALQTFSAVNLLKSAGISVGAQLMIGLPLETSQSLFVTAAGVIQLNPDFVRIYPVLVLRNSQLARLYEEKKYTPLSLGKAVVKAAWLKKRFVFHGIRVVRIGLQPGPDLEEALMAGPYHPAFGELVNSRIMLQITRAHLASIISKNEKPTLVINEKDQSVFRGMKSANIKRLKELGLVDSFVLATDPDQKRLTVQFRM